MVGKIKGDTAQFMANLLVDKLEKVVNAIVKIQSHKTISFINIQSLIIFLFFCLQTVRLSHVFIKKLQDFVNLYFCNELRTIFKRISIQIREDPEQWNQVFLIYNEILFFNTKNHDSQTFYLDTYLYSLGGFFFRGTKIGE